MNGADANKDAAQLSMDAYGRQAQTVKSQLPEELRDRIAEYGKQASNEIQRIIDSYRTPEKKPR